MKSLSVTLSLSFFLFASILHAEEIKDPFEPVNRGVFWFNERLDKNLLEPVARGYDSVMPQFAKNGVGNFFTNIKYPSYLVSDLVQFKFEQAATHTGRFFINTTIGLLGFIDVASDMGLEHNTEDFGLALAYYDVPPGPYLVLPIIGPSNVRDGVGLLVDFLLDPFTWLAYSDAPDRVRNSVTLSAFGIKLIHTRARLIDAIESGRKASVDYYLFLQSAYYQYRRGELYDGNPPDEEEDLDSSSVDEGDSAESDTKTDAPSLSAASAGD